MRVVRAKGRVFRRRKPGFDAESITFRRNAHKLRDFLLEHRDKEQTVNGLLQM
jgi:hypothetical protein